MCLESRVLALVFSVAASPALAASATAPVPPPPYLVQPVMVLLTFLAIFVGAAWSLSALMGLNHRPIGHYGRKRRRQPRI